jgi:hypothetical protein
MAAPYTAGSHAFISYARDDEDRALAVRERLTRQGVASFVDTDTIQLGDDWRRVVTAALDTSFVVIVVCTRASVASVEVGFEWAYAVGRGLPVLPLVYENELVLHPALQQLDHLDFTSPQNRQWDRLLARVDAEGAKLSSSGAQRPGNEGREQQSMREVIGCLTDSLTLVIPAQSRGAKDPIALMHLVEVCGRLGYHLAATPSDAVVDGRDRLVVGGRLVNGVAADYLDRLCPGLHVRKNERGRNVYECGECTFVDPQRGAYGFLVRLTPEITHESGIVHLIWGDRGTGTAAAAYFLTHHHRVLSCLFGGSSFFVAVKSTNDYTSARFKADLTLDALGESEVGT